MTQEQRRYSGQKWIGNFLRNRVEEGQEIGFTTPALPEEDSDYHYHVGEVQSVQRNEDPERGLLGGDLDYEIDMGDPDLTEVSIGGGWVLCALVGDWTDNYREDWKVWAEAPTGDELPIECLYDWDADTRSPDEHLDDLDEQMQADVREGMGEVLDDLDDVLDDIRFIKEAIAELKLGNITLAEYERRIEEREAESGGSLALDAI